MRARAATLAAFVSLTLTAPAYAQSVRPTSATVPENLLRLSVVFDTPPAGPVLPRLALRLADGSIVSDPFLEQELWSPDGRVLTVLMHPGRVKTGLNASERLGRALRVGERVTVTLDGRPRRTWSVTASDETPPEPQRWTVAAPSAGTRDPVSVRLDDQVDAFGADLIAVRGPDGARVPGHAELLAGETIWRFEPDSPWRPGPHAIVAAPTLEDPSGNRPGSTFEHPPGAEDGTAMGPTVVVGPPRSTRRPTRSK